jgi:hypothetical protein
MFTPRQVIFNLISVDKISLTCLPIQQLVELSIYAAHPEHMVTLMAHLNIKPFSQSLLSLFVNIPFLQPIFQYLMTFYAIFINEPAYWELLCLIFFIIGGICQFNYSNFPIKNFVLDMIDAW